MKFRWNFLCALCMHELKDNFEMEITFVWSLKLGKLRKKNKIEAYSIPLRSTLRITENTCWFDEANQLRNFKFQSHRLT